MVQFSITPKSACCPGVAPSSLNDNARLRDVTDSEGTQATRYLITGTLLGNPIHLTVATLDGAIKGLDLLSAAGDSLANFAPGIHGVARDRLG